MLIKMSNDIYRQSYHPHPQKTAIDQQRNTDFIGMNPMMSVFLNAIESTAPRDHFHKGHPNSAFIPEPRIHAMETPELPEFFRQSHSFSKNIPHSSRNSIYNECLLKPVKNPFPPPSPLMLQPNLLLEKTVEHRLNNKSAIPHANGIMSENVQQRYLFSKKPNYGPLSIPVTTTYHPVTNDIYNNQSGPFYDNKEVPSYNYKFRSFGRRSSDAREPMPKLGQGDARLGDGILFSERKVNTNPNTVSGCHAAARCIVPASPPSLTYSPYSPKSLASNHRSHIDTTSFSTRNLHSQSPQRAPVPIPIGPAPENFKKKHFNTPPTPSRDGTDSRFCISKTYENQLRTKSTTTSSTSLEGVHSNHITEAAKKHTASSLQNMTSNHRHQFDATAPEFEPAVKSPIRTRPPKWKTQCKWTYARVDDCRYGQTCHWGHEGDEYLDMPGVKHTFINGNPYGGDFDNGNQRDQAQYNQMQYDPSEYSVYSASSSYEALQNPDYGIQLYSDGRMPDFSWAGGATNVSGWLGSQAKNTHARSDSQIYDRGNLYHHADQYTGSQIGYVSEFQADAPSGPHRKNYIKKKSKIDPRHRENNLKQVSTDETTMVGEAHNEQLWDFSTTDVGYENLNEQTKHQDISTKHTDYGEIDVQKQFESLLMKDSGPEGIHMDTKKIYAHIGGAK